MALDGRARENGAGGSLIATWTGWIDQVARDVMLLRAHQLRWEELLDVVQTNQGLPKDNAPLRWIAELYGAAMVVGLRRQTDRRRDIVSITRIMHGIASNPTELTRARQRELWQRAVDWPLSEELRCDADALFDEFSGPDQSEVDPRVIRGHAKRLKETTAGIKAYVDTSIAHLGQGPPVPVPLFSEVHAALDHVAGLVRRYSLLLKGTHLMEPVLQFDFLAAMETAWAPPSLRARRTDREG
ncbi:MAG: hypothetical protein ACYDAD_14525 [Acidimicrobiales bacterium]